MKSMVFAAGLGTRLRPLTDDRPKALVEVAGRPMMDRLLEKLQAAGFNDIVVNVHHFPDLMCAHLASQWPSVAVSDERDALLETGGALKKAAPLLRAAGSGGLGSGGLGSGGGLLAAPAGALSAGPGGAISTVPGGAISTVPGAPAGPGSGGAFLAHNVDILSDVDLRRFWAEAMRLGICDLPGAPAGPGSGGGLSAVPGGLAPGPGGALLAAPAGALSAGPGAPVGPGSGGGLLAAPAGALSAGSGGAFLAHNVDILSDVDLRRFWAEAMRLGICDLPGAPGHAVPAASGSAVPAASGSAVPAAPEAPGPAAPSASAAPSLAPGASGPEPPIAVLLVTDRPSSRSLLFDDGMRLVGWRNNVTGDLRTPYPHLDPSTCHAYAFSGIHIIAERLLDLLESWPERFSITDFYIANCAAHTILGHLDPTARVLDLGKPEALAQASALLAP